MNCSHVETFGIVVIPQMVCSDNFYLKSGTVQVSEDERISSLLGKGCFKKSWGYIELGKSEMSNSEGGLCRFMSAPSNATVVKYKEIYNQFSQTHSVCTIIYSQPWSSGYLSIPASIQIPVSLANTNTSGICSGRV